VLLEREVSPKEDSMDFSLTSKQAVC